MDDKLFDKRRLLYYTVTLQTTISGLVGKT